MKIAIATGTRADWGLLSPIAQLLKAQKDVEVAVIATNMHLDPRFGNTIDEIISDGFIPAAKVKMNIASNSEADTARSMAKCLSGMVDAFESIKPDCIIILGDRYEMLATASAATVMRIPIIHIAGGEISEGAIDDCIRHAITKLSALHLTSTEEYRQRVIAMGEQPDRVINTGAIGVYNIMQLPLMSKEELEKSIGCKINKRTLLVTMHPTTIDPTPSSTVMGELFKALDAHDGNVIITYPNNDARGAEIISLIDDYQKRNKDKVTVIPSLGRLRYLSALQFAGAVAGNSSSGIVEVPSMHIPTVNIGIRQKGRLASKSVINCGNSAQEIISAIRFALSEEGQDTARNAENPYYKPNTLHTIVNSILSVSINDIKTKKFYDIPHTLIQ
ncbi:MAG: UDP-N-acetylglucosamine 2-epimerase [Bacteroidales bacterium]|nr:UDP-N-acetylglucosamine 2-epimerase [Bacteroidales bacterium]